MDINTIFVLLSLFSLLYSIMIKRVIVLPENKTAEISKITEVDIKPINTQGLLELNNKSHFTLSFIKDEKINNYLQKFFKIYIISMIDFYEYKESDNIIISNGKNNDIKILILKPIMFTLRL